MTTDDWRRVLHQTAELGVSEVQFIGGEPTLHPDLPDLLHHALESGLEAEVYSNLARPLPEQLWALFERAGVQLATSYYAVDAVTHDAITTRRGSHAWTRANIAEARRRGIRVRAGIVSMHDDQHVEAAVADLEALGVSVRVDRLRRVGRGVRDQTPDVDQLCGRCADGSLAVLPTGEVLPCVFARWLVLGNVGDASLQEINRVAASTRGELRSRFEALAGRDPQCDPSCDPRCSPREVDRPFPGCPPTDPKR